MNKNVVILISGRGSNMQSIVNANIIGAKIVAVISNRPDAGGLAWAQERGIATAVLNHRDFDNREAFDAQLQQVIDAYQPDLVVLAGFMRILTANFCLHYQNRMLNIHPSLLPSFKGLHTHQAAIDAGCKLAGCTVHFVTPELDHGPIISQGAVPILPDDSADDLAARILTVEHQLYPQAVADFVTGRLSVQDGKVINAQPTDAQNKLLAY
ncbi:MULTISPECIES: phosphoribosylglycinamide formyltransferase [Vitreoscilla]|uniref:Phosphoribosylglycinamide formyltransferase n=1 Tax=Vitreoscilla stercoraria TaxID=61 RepID=A0ABY4E9L9_VITST|nr:MULTISPECIES: phosphoribosylglycinamide formyltransferase [Vitreoscilla]AUZ04222.1 phosphoribosylglycinamide formyltransferase [Vitreoscilla sp. C1]UOO92023.1 phosphoribosylglycinamide formyltransferase [Vitreoscilla stercoraria]